MVIQIDEVRSNLHPESAPFTYSIPIGFGNIELALLGAHSFSARLLTNDGDFLVGDSTNVKDGVIKLPLHKPDAVSSNTFTRIELLGSFLLEVKKVVHRKEEVVTFAIDVRR